jgi:hypothetical protein
MNSRRASARIGWILVPALSLQLGAAPTPAAARSSSSQATYSAEVFHPDGTITRVRVRARDPVPPTRAEAAALEGSSVYPLHVAGPSENRFDLVIVGDGYTPGELELFHEQAQRSWDRLAGLEPYASYLSFFNVWVVDVVSNESGVDNDPYPPAQRDTALDMGFWCQGIERLMCVNATKARAAAAAAPGADQIVALAHSVKYGGSGGIIASSSAGSAQAEYIVPHELGHSIGRLLDEYDHYVRAGLSEQAEDDVRLAVVPYPGVIEPSGRNVSAMQEPQMRASHTKWWRWLGETSPDGGIVSTYEGANYYRNGQYRPTENSLMKGGRVFNLIGLEEMTRAFYKWVHPVDAATPADHPLAGGDVVRVELVHPTSHRLTVTWLLDDVEVPDTAGLESFTLTQDMADRHATLTARIADTTPFVRDPAYQDALTQRLDWSV